MDTRIVSALAAWSGVTSTVVLAAAGVSERSIAVAVRTGELVRVRRGAFVAGGRWRAATAWDKHGLRARAVAAAANPTGSGPIALSHQSALAVAGVDLYGVDERVHLMRTDGRRGRGDRLLATHRPRPVQVVAADGVLTVGVADACLQVAAEYGVEAGLVSANSALHTHRVTASELSSALERGRYRQYTTAPARVVALADPRIESPAESRAVWVMNCLGLPRVEPQVTIRDPSGKFVARVDFLLGERVVVEIDGMGKYDSPEALRAEKVREDRLRELGYEVVRLTWRHLSEPDRVYALVTAALVRARRRRHGW